LQISTENRSYSRSRKSSESDDHHRIVRSALDDHGSGGQAWRMDSTSKDRAASVRTAPLTPERWADLETVFGGGRGDCGRCWCMYWRLPRRDFEASLGAKARQLFRARVEAGPPPGLVAYRDDDPVGWVQVGPRAEVPEWNGARRLTAPMPDAPADDPRVWGISCFVTKSGCRRRGIATALLAAAIDWARENNARVLDACPVDPRGNRPAVALYHGIASTFRAAGFREVARRRPDRPLMRLEFTR
jgi:GNAT superfamily N-acetyltransferase